MAIAYKCKVLKPIPKKTIFFCSKTWCKRAFTKKCICLQHQQTCIKKSYLTKTCKICKKTLSGKTNLARHMLLHKNKIKYKCIQCNKFFYGKDIYDIHVSSCFQSSQLFLDSSSEYDDIKAVVEITPGTNVGYSAINKRINDVDKEEPEKNSNTVLSSFCNHSALTTANIIIDSKPEMGVESVCVSANENNAPANDQSKTCHICDKTFTRRTNLRRHLALHSNKKSCESYETLTEVSNNGYTFENLSDLPTMESSLLSTYGNLPSMAIGEFPSKEEINSSLNDQSFYPSFVINDIHSTQEKSGLSQSIDDSKTCNICDKTFTRKTNLRRHMVTHGDKHGSVSNEPNDHLVDKMKYSKDNLASSIINVDENAEGMRQMVEIKLSVTSNSQHSSLESPDTAVDTFQKFSSDSNLQVFSHPTVPTTLFDIYDLNVACNSHSGKTDSQVSTVMLSTDTFSCDSNIGYKIAENVRNYGEVKDFSKTCYICHKTFTRKRNLLKHMTLHSQKQDKLYHNTQKRFHLETLINNQMSIVVSQTGESFPDSVNQLSVTMHPSTNNNLELTDDQNILKQSLLNNSSTNFCFTDRNFDLLHEVDSDDSKFIDHEYVPSISSSDESIPVVFPSDYENISTKLVINDKKISEKDFPTGNSLIACSSISENSFISSDEKLLVHGYKKPLYKSVAKGKLKMCHICKKTFTRNTNLRKHLLAKKCKPDSNNDTYEKSVNSDVLTSKSPLVQKTVNYFDHDNVEYSNYKQSAIIDDNTPVVIPSDCFDTQSSVLKNRNFPFVEAQIPMNNRKGNEEIPEFQPVIINNSVSDSYEVCNLSNIDDFDRLSLPNEEFHKNCHICGKTFTRAYNLRRHLVTHRQGYIFNRYKYSVTKDKIDENSLPKVVSYGGNLANQSLISMISESSNEINKPVHSIPKQSNSQSLKNIDKYRSNIARRTCSICNKVFTRTTTLRRHMNIHKKPNFKCKNCPKSFHLKDKFAIHVELCSLNNHSLNYLSDVRNSLPQISSGNVNSLINLSDYDLPLEGVEEAPIIDVKSPISSIPRESEDDLNSYLVRSYVEPCVEKEKSKLNSRTCHLCKKVFTRTTTLRRHMQVHRRTNFKCDRCQVSFTNKDIFTRHLAKCGHMINPSVPTIGHGNSKSPEMDVDLDSSLVDDLNTESLSKNSFESSNRSQLKQYDNKFQIRNSLSLDEKDTLSYKETYLGSNDHPTLSDDIIIVKPSDQEDFLPSTSSNLLSPNSPSYSEDQINFLQFDGDQYSKDARKIKSQEFKPSLKDDFSSNDSFLSTEEGFSVVNKSLNSLCNISKFKPAAENDTLSSFDTKNTKKASFESYQPKTTFSSNQTSVLYESSDNKSCQVKWKQKAARTCHICNKTFTRTTTLRRHMNIHNKKSSNKCVRCNLTFQGQEAFDAHCKKCASNVLKDENHVDCVNSIGLTTGTSLNPTIVDSKSYTVKNNEETNQYSGNSKAQKVIVKSNISNKTCSICNKTFTRTTTLRRHLLIHKNKPSILCGNCQQVFHGKESYGRHKINCVGRSVINDCSENRDVFATQNDNCLPFDNEFRSMGLRSSLRDVPKRSLDTSLNNMLLRKRFSS